MASAPSHPEILIVGGLQVGKKALAARLLGRPPRESAQPDIWSIDTKYYSAQASVVLRSPGGEGSAKQASEAVVLVFDATRQDSLALVQQWAAMSRADAAEVRLLVANKVDRLVEQPPPANGSAQPAPPPAPRRSPWLVAAQAWCSEHLYEYVEVSAADERLDATLDLDGERQGLHRVAAALKAHTWPGLARKQARAGAAGPAPPPAAAAPAAAAASCNSTPASAAEGGADGNQAVQAGASEAGRDAGAPAPSEYREREGCAGAGPGGEHDEPRPTANRAGVRGNESHPPSDGSGAGTGAAQPQENGHGGAADGSSGRAGVAAGAGGSAWGLGAGDGLGEGLEDNFERLLGGMAAERARIRGLPDADRRAAAARMAERLLAAVGLDDDDASDSDAA